MITKVITLNSFHCLVTVDVHIFYLNQYTKSEYIFKNKKVQKQTNKETNKQTNKQTYKQTYKMVIKDTTLVIILVCTIS